MNASVLQKKAAVDMLRAMVHCGRAKQADLDRAELELLELQNQTQELPKSPEAYSPKSAEIIPKPVTHSPSSNHLSQTAAISKEIECLQRQMADLSNELHNIPETVPCPGLTSQIIALKKQIEDLWTKKHLLDRNRTSAPVATAVDVPTHQVDPADETLLLQLTHERQRLADKRSKLRKKLTDPKKSVAKNAEWSQELVKVEFELNAKDVEIQLVRARL